MTSTGTISHDASSPIPTSIAERASFEIIRYANCWEDADLLMSALAPKKSDRCLSIASGGDNSLSLLSSDPAIVIALDISAAQIALVALKAAAIASLRREEFLGFAGFRTPSNDRIEIYRSLREGLSVDARNYWDSRHEVITNGIIHAGKFEHYFSLFRRWIIPLVHNRRTVQALTAPKNAEERRRFYNEEWNTPRWRALFRLFFSRFVMGRLGRDPEFFRWIEGSVAEHILQRVSYALTELDVGTNPFANYIVTGSFGDALPHYVRPETYSHVQRNIERLELVCGDLGGYLVDYSRKNPTRPITCFNLSDIFEYLDPASFESTARVILDHAPEGGRLAYWNMLAPRRISEIFPDRVHWHREESERLLKSDRAFFYRAFILEEVLSVNPSIL